MGVSVAWPRPGVLLPPTSTATTRSSTRRAPSIALTPTQGVLLCAALPRTVTMTSMRPLLASATRPVVPMTMTASLGIKPSAVADADGGVVPAGLARRAHREHQPAAQREAVGGGLHRRQRRGERAFLLRHAAAAHIGAGRILDQLAGIRDRACGSPDASWRRPSASGCCRRVAARARPRDCPCGRAATAGRAVAPAERPRRR